MLFCPKDDECVNEDTLIDYLQNINMLERVCNYNPRPHNYLLTYVLTSSIHNPDLLKKIRSLN